MTTIILIIIGLLCFELLYKSVDWFEKFKMIGLLIVAIGVFIYMGYVLVKPEKF